MPLIQDKLTKELKEEGGDGLGQIGRAEGWHRGNKGAAKGQPSGALRDGLAAGEGADPECGNGVGVEAAGSGAWSRGAAPANQPPRFWG